MKSVLISIRPNWCELIAKLEKTIEVRKTKPAIETHFKAYIYCTKDNSTIMRSQTWKRNNHVMNGKVIGEFVCDWINEYTAEFVEDEDCYESIRQIFEDDGEEDFCTITSNEDDNPDICTLCEKSCLSFKDIKKYIGINFHDKKFYGWHISALDIYDEPKELSEFYKADFEEIYSQWEDIHIIGTKGVNCVEYPPEPNEEDYKLKRAPQSWCYVWEAEE